MEDVALLGISKGLSGGTEKRMEARSCITEEDIPRLAPMYVLISNYFSVFVFYSLLSSKKKHRLGFLRIWRVLGTFGIYGANEEILESLLRLV